jgi:tetratricopeptide (TPR) repeat protein
MLRDALKEKSMKRTISLWLSLPAVAGLLAIAALPALAQAPAPTGKIHGHVTNPTGAPQSGGTVSLVATDRLASGPGLAAMTSNKGSFPVNAAGDYSGEAPVGTYTVVYRTEGMAQDKVSDKIEGVKIVVGQDTVQDLDMSRKDYIDALPPDQKKQLEDLRKHNSEAMKANEVVKSLNNDLKIVTQDVKDADAAKATVEQTLGATAPKADRDAKEAEIKTAKYTEVEGLMLKDTALKPTESILWADLGLAQVGLKKYDDAETSFKKALDLEANSKKPRPEVSGQANAGLGEIYARTGKVDEANAAYDAAVKANPAQGTFYLRNEAVIFFQLNNAAAQVAAANEALKLDPNQPVLYYIIGQGLVQNASIDPKTNRIVLPPGCAEAYQKYLDLQPTGPYAADAKGILEQANQKISTSFKADTKKK